MRNDNREEGAMNNKARILVGVLLSPVLLPVGLFIGVFFIAIQCLFVIFCLAPNWIFFGQWEWVWWIE